MTFIYDTSDPPSIVVVVYRVDNLPLSLALTIMLIQPKHLPILMPLGYRTSRLVVGMHI